MDLINDGLSKSALAKSERAREPLLKSTIREHFWRDQQDKTSPCRDSHPHLVWFESVRVYRRCTEHLRVLLHQSAQRTDHERQGLPLKPCRELVDQRLSGPS